MKMKYLLLGLIPLVCLVVALSTQEGLTFFDKKSRDGRLREGVRSTTRDFANLHSRKSRAEREREYDAIFAALLARFPELEPEWKNVPDERNGFLRLYGFLDSLEMGSGGESSKPLFHSALTETGYYGDDWDSEKASELCSQYAELIDELTLIGLLEQQSSAGVPISKLANFENAINIRYCNDLLLASARYTATQGDVEVAMERLNASFGIADHLLDIETPSLLHNTVGIVMQLKASSAMVEKVLPYLSLNQEDIVTLRKNFNTSELNRDAVKLWRGEFMVAGRALLIPELYKGNRKMVRIESTADVYAQIFSNALGEIEGLSDQELFALNDSEINIFNISNIEIGPHVDVEILPNIADSFKPYHNGFLRSYVVTQQHDALLAILAGEKIPIEPFTGQPYIYDEETQTLSLPDDPRLESMKVKPISLSVEP